MLTTSVDRGYYCSENKRVDCDVKFKRKEKFPPKILVWTAISHKESPRLYFFLKKGAIIEPATVNSVFQND